jgi:hypothetical protein
MTALSSSMRWLALTMLVACAAPQPPTPATPATPEPHRTPFARSIPRAVDDAPAPIATSGTCIASQEVRACITAPIIAPAQALALATTDDLAAIAWASSGSQCGVQLERIDENLIPLGHTLCIEKVPSVTHIALAATPTGWLLAASSYPDGVVVFTIDPAGRNATRTHVIQNARTPIFAARPNGTPLLVWTEHDGELRAALVSAEGIPARGATVFLPQATQAEFGSAVFTGDGFLVAARQDRGTPTTTDEVIVARVELDGRVSSVEKPAGVNTEYPQLAWTRSGALVTYANFNGRATLESVLVDARAGRKRAPVAIGGTTDGGSRTVFFDPAPGIGVGDDALVLAGHYTGGTGIAGGLALLRVAPNGALARPIVEVTSQTPITQYRIGKRKNDAVAAWIWQGTSSLGLARIAL